LDQADLFSPVDGTILDDSSLSPGVYLTPSSSPIVILDAQGYFFEITIEEADLIYFLNPKTIMIEVQGLQKTLEGQTSPAILPIGETGKFAIRVALGSAPGLFYGLKAEARFL